MAAGRVRSIAGREAVAWSGRRRRHRARSRRGRRTRARDRGRSRRSHLAWPVAVQARAWLLARASSAARATPPSASVTQKPRRSRWRAAKLAAPSEQDEGAAALASVQAAPDQREGAPRVAGGARRRGPRSPCFSASVAQARSPEIPIARTTPSVARRPATMPPSGGASPGMGAENTDAIVPPRGRHRAPAELPWTRRGWPIRPRRRPGPISRRRCIPAQGDHGQHPARRPDPDAGRRLALPAMASAGFPIRHPVGYPGTSGTRSGARSPPAPRRCGDRRAAGEGQRGGAGERVHARRRSAESEASNIATSMPLSLGVASAARQDVAELADVPAQSCAARRARAGGEGSRPGLGRQLLEEHSRDGRDVARRSRSGGTWTTKRSRRWKRSHRNSPAVTRCSSGACVAARTRTRPLPLPGRSHAPIS